MPAKKSLAAKKATKPQNTAEFAATFAALREIFSPHTRHLRVTVDKPGRYYAMSRSATRKGKPLFFGAVISGKAYVSFHLVPIYMNPALQQTVSPALKKRQQGKACFHFTKPDPALFRELATLTAAGSAFFHASDFPEHLAKSVADAKRQRASQGLLVKPSARA